MKRVAIVLCLLASAAAVVNAQQGFKAIKEFLSGYEEVPAVSMVDFVNNFAGVSAGMYG